MAMKHTVPSTLPIPARLPAEFQDQAVRILAGLRAAGDVQTVLVFRGSLDRDRLARAVRLMLDAEPVLGCRFDEEEPAWVRQRRF